MCCIPCYQGKIPRDAYPCYQDILVTDQVSSLLQLIIYHGRSFSLLFIQGKNRYYRNQIVNLRQSFLADNAGIQLK